MKTRKGRLLKAFIFVVSNVILVNIFLIIGYFCMTLFYRHWLKETMIIVPLLLFIASFYVSITTALYGIFYELLKEKNKITRFVVSNCYIILLFVMLNVATHSSNLEVAGWSAVIFYFPTIIVCSTMFGIAISREMLRLGSKFYKFIAMFLGGIIPFTIISFFIKSNLMPFLYMSVIGLSLTISVSIIVSDLLLLNMSKYNKASE